MKNHVSFRWKVASLPSFYNRLKGEWISSPRFDVWRMQIFPNGFKSDSVLKLKISLKNLFLPPNVNTIIANVTILIKQCDIRWKKKVQFDLKNKFVSFVSDTLMEGLKKLKELHINCYVDVLSLYDMNEKEIGMIQENENEEIKSLKNELIDLRKELNELKELNNYQKKRNEEISNTNWRKSDYDKLTKWLEDKVELPEYLELFIECGWDSLSTVRYMTDRHLQQMGITKMGHRVKIMKIISEMTR